VAVWRCGCAASHPRHPHLHLHIRHPSWVPCSGWARELDWPLETGEPLALALWAGVGVSGCLSIVDLTIESCARCVLALARAQLASVTSPSSLGVASLGVASSS
jgi:hypothetical protein